MSPWLQFILRYRAWLIVSLAILFALTIRLRIREMPLERDEGEYAYAGQLILEGVPPYKLAYNMKLPGTYAAYALFMALFGQTPAGIHIGLAIMNAGSILLMFFLGRQVLDENAGIASAVIFGLLSLNPDLLALSAHATHFVVFPALLGVLLLRRAAASGPVWTFVASGFFFGLALVMKQHGAFFGLFGLAYLLWVKTRSRSEDWMRAIRDLGLFLLGWILPYAITCVLMLWAGVFHQFFFWTFTYARAYATEITGSVALALLRFGLSRLAGADLTLWILPLLAVVWMSSDRRLEGRRFFILAFLLSSVAALSAGFYFRQHYFILVIPAAALLSGCAISRALRRPTRRKPITFLLASLVLLLVLVGIVRAFAGFGLIWFELSPTKVSQTIYQTTLFSDTVTAADYIRAHTGKEDRIAVLGSEPEIYFYSRRRSATGYIYTYPLMEKHAFASKMQDEMIAEIERERPRFVAFIQDQSSWLARTRSRARIRDWWNAYWPLHYQVEKAIPITTEYSVDSGQGNPLQTFILVLKRTD